MPRPTGSYFPGNHLAHVCEGLGQLRGKQRNVVTAEDEIGAQIVPFVHIVISKGDAWMLAGIWRAFGPRSIPSSCHRRRSDGRVAEHARQPTSRSAQTGDIDAWGIQDGVDLGDAIEVSICTITMSRSWPGRHRHRSFCHNPRRAWGRSRVPCGGYLQAETAARASAAELTIGIRSRRRPYRVPV